MHCYNKNDIYINPVVIINQILKIHVQVIFSIKYPRKCRIDIFPVQLKSFVHDFFFHFKSGFFPINIYDKVYLRKEIFSLAKVKRKLSNQLYCSFKLQSQLKVNGA